MGKISFPEEAKRFPLEIQSSLRKPKAFQNNSNLSRRETYFPKENEGFLRRTKFVKMQAKCLY